MDNENLDGPAPTIQAPVRFAPASQLLIEMSDEHAARLLVRSLVDQVLQLTAPLDAAGPALPQHPSGWRAAIDRLDTCLALYSSALDGSVPKKSRRKVRQLARRAARVDRREALVAWLIPFSEAVRSPEHASDDAVAATWLQRRLADRVDGVGGSIKNAQRDIAKLQSLDKALSVYTTSVQIDDMPRMQSFGALTAELLRDESAELARHFDELELSSVRSMASLLAATRRIGYLLGPVRVHVPGGTGVSESVNALQSSLERLAELGGISNAILRAGKRAGSAHMRAVLTRELFGTRDGDASTSHGDLRRGLVALARVLHAELSASLQHFRGTWPRESVVGLIQSIADCASLLRRS